MAAPRTAAACGPKNGADKTSAGDKPGACGAAPQKGGTLTVLNAVVMRGGSAVERGVVAGVLADPSDVYTAALLAAVPRLDAPRVPRPGASRALPVPAPQTPPATAGRGPRAGLKDRGSAPDPAPQTPAGLDLPVVEAFALRKGFGRGKGRVEAVGGVSLVVRAGETLGVVGESGSGKSTLGRMLVGLLEPSSGQVRRDGRETVGVVPGVQMVFQDPVSSLNPRRSIGESIADPLRVRGAGRRPDEAAVRERVGALLVRFGLEAGHYDRYPHEFSGGQRQRVGIARALAPAPRLIVCDEPVCALDVTTQAQVTALLAELQRELGIALVFIAHASPWCVRSATGSRSCAAA